MKTILITGSLAMLTSLAQAATINIAFHNGNTTVNGFNTRPDGSVVSAGTNGSDTWNNVSRNGADGLTFTGKALSYDDGSGSGATLDSNAGSSYFNTSNWGSGTDDWVMMEGWYGMNGTESLTINNLPSALTSSGYTITIYGDADNNRTMSYTIGGVTKTINDTAGFNGTFTEGSDYVVFTGLTDASFTIFGNDSSGPRSAIGGIVITAVPEPSSAALLGLGGLSMVLRRKR